MVIGVLKNCHYEKQGATLTRQNSPKERREPVVQRERLAPVSIRVPTNHTLSNVLLVKAEPDPGDQEAELDDDIWTLEADDAHDGRKSDIGHGQGLRSRNVRYVFRLRG